MGWKALITTSLLALVLAGGCGPSGSDGGTSDVGMPPPDAGPPLPDEDGDGIADEHEGRDENLDTDGDGTPDYLDLDSDGDGIPDSVEAGDPWTQTPPDDADGDGTPNFQDQDSDDNGIVDAMDSTEDLDGDGAPDFMDMDDDGDEIFDFDEIGPPQMPTDSDGDGDPDYQDPDSDNDTILDGHEGSSFDTDGDGVLDRFDDDSDDDGIPDIIEAGDGDIWTFPVDTDGDMIPDFRDVDSDNDGLPDNIEDINGDGIVDPGETDPYDDDSDDDGIPDLVEVAAGTDPLDPGSTIDPGDFFFILPYMGPGDDDILDFATEIVSADIHLQVDTTGSMGGTVDNLQTGLTTIVIPGVAAAIADVAFSVAEFEDFPLAGFGAPDCPSPGVHDTPFRLHTRVTTDIMAAQAAVDLLDMPLGCGSDGNESGFEALYQAATGEGIFFTGGDGEVPKFLPSVGLIPGVADGPLGGAGFRVGSLPIFIHATDANSHPAADYIGAGVTTAHSLLQTEAALNAIGAKVIGVAVGGFAGSVRTELEGIAFATGAAVPPSAFSTCGAGMCCTGLMGTGLPPDVATGLCPLVFDIDSGGTGLSTAIVDAIVALTQFGDIDISARAVGDPALLPGLDTSAFVTAFVPVPPAPMGSSIVGDEFHSVQPGNPIQFEVLAFNDFVMPTDTAQLFTITIQVLGDGVTILDTRDVFVIVPPLPPGPPIE